MKRALLVLVAVVVANLVGCSQDRAKETMDTARLEEKQHNLGYARQLYREIVEKYPGTPLAKEAQERLDALKGKP